MKEPLIRDRLRICLPNGTRQMATVIGKTAVGAIRVDLLCDNGVKLWNVDMNILPGASA